MTFSLMDLILIIAVSSQCVIMAYLRNPVAKSLVLTIPIPVTFGILSVGRPIDITNVGGLILSLAFTMTVLILYRVLHVQILISIVTAALSYCVAALVLASLLPRTELIFWLGVGAIIIIGLSVFHAMPPIKEASYRSPLPVWIKTIIVLSVVSSLVFIKKELQGFMTTFPMLGVVASYESRNSLYTTSRQIPITVTAFAVMFGVCHILQEWMSVYFTLIPGLVVYMIIVFVLNTSKNSHAKIENTFIKI